jgi:hypothetical protein
LSSGGEVHQGVRIVGHPLYQAEGFGTYENDISLVEVETDIVFATNVQPAALGTVSIGAGVNGVLAG